MLDVSVGVNPRLNTWPISRPLTACGISGTVRRASGAPGKGMRVTLAKLESRSPMSFAITNESGSFQIQGFEEFDYILYAGEHGASVRVGLKCGGNRTFDLRLPRQ